MKTGRAEGLKPILMSTDSPVEHKPKHKSLGLISIKALKKLKPGLLSLPVHCGRVPSGVRLIGSQ